MKTGNALTLQQINAIRVIAQTGSATQAAQHLGISQPAVSKLIAKAEADLGLSLLRRETRPLRLTVEGALVARHGQDLDRILTTLSERLEAMRAGQAGSVRVGSFGPTASTRLLPGLLSGFSKKYPAIEVRLTEAPDQQTQADLQTGVLDVAVLANPSDGLDCIPLAVDQLVAIVPEGSDLADKARITAKDLQPWPFIMTLAGSEPVIRDWFAADGGRPGTRHSIQQTHSILALVACNMGCSIVTSQSLPEILTGVKAIPLSPEQENDICLVRLPAAAPSQAAQLFWDYVKRV